MKGFLFLLLCFNAAICSSQVYGPVLVQWDFANGIEPGWENVSTDGISEWVYRGQNTEPSNAFGPVGSCAINAMPINSPTASNGFVIFDANFWDALEGPCGGDNIGTGASPAPHLATLTTPSFSLEGESNVMLTFVQQYRHFNTETSVEISVDNGVSWNTVHTNPTGQNTQSSPGEWVNINISAVAGNQSNVRIRFKFDGFYYWWLLDDITIYRPAVNNLELVAAYFSGFDGQTEPDGLGNMEYTGYPSIMTPIVQPVGQIKNVGSASQNGVRLNAVLTNADGVELYNQLSSATTLSSNSSANLSISTTYNIPSTTESYDVQLTAIQNQTDEQPELNVSHKSFKVTPYTYQFDLDIVEQSFTPPANFQNLPYQIGCAYETKEDSLQLHGLGVAITAPTQPGVEIYGLIYNANFTQVLMETDPYVVNAWDINEIGEGKFVHLQFQEPFFTEANALYIVMVGTLDAIENMVHIGRSGPSFSTSSLVRYNNSATFFMPRAMMVRAHLFEKDATPGCLDTNAMNFNPAADTDDGSCRYPGCIDPEAINFDSNANFATETCQYFGCTDSDAANYDPAATNDDGSCEYPGCTDPEALNFDQEANVNDGSCSYSQAFLGASDTLGCAPQTVTFFNQTDNVSESECQFIFDDVVLYDTCIDEFEITFDTPGTYFVTYHHTVFDVSTTSTVGPIQIYATPETPEIELNESGPALVCSNCGTNTVQWWLNDEPIEGANGTVFVPTENGLYALVISTSVGCTAISNELDVTVVSVEEETLTDVLLYPNPAKTHIRIRSVERIQNLTIYDQRGKIVATQEHLENDAEIGVEMLPSGLYLLRIEGERQQQTLRLIIER